MTSNRSACFTSATRGHDEWFTPDAVFDQLHEEFGFTLDAAATAENSKCQKFFTRSVDGLFQSWEGETIWCNPPYSGINISKFLHKAQREQAKGVTSVLLLPTRTGNDWFHKYCLSASEIRFVRGRLKFGGAPHNAAFDSMIVIFRGTRVS